jgi:hypothetical protein
MDYIFIHVQPLEKHALLHDRPASDKTTFIDETGGQSDTAADVEDDEQ